MSEAAVTVKQALQAAAAMADRLDAQLLLLYVLQRQPGDRSWLVAHDTDALPTGAWERFIGLCRRRAEGEPVAYLTGRKEFYGLSLSVDARVLVPRPDTETLVDWALVLLEGAKAPQLLDLGTGSGAIALALKHARPDARVSAVDASPGALAVAQANAARLALQVAFSEGSWLDGITARYDMIVSNPPYIAEGDAHLPGLRQEPLEALVSGVDGLDDIRRIIAQAPDRLSPGGWLLLEHGWDQAPAVRALLREAGFDAVASRNDLAGIERCSGGKLPVRG